MGRLATLAVLLSVSSPARAQVALSPNFENPPVHGAAVSDDGARLYVVHPAAGRLAVFSLAQPDRPVRLDSIPVGLEPVSVRLRNDHEAWVVNRLSDSISIVSLSLRAVVATIATADEPADVVFAGHPRRAFVSAAGADLVQVLDPETHREVARIPIPGEAPTALATDARGQRVFVVVQRSGNGTTVVPMAQAPAQPPPRSPRLPPAPQVPLIVAADDPRWTAAHGITLADIDLAEIDAHRLRIHRTVARLGTTNFGLAVHPRRDEVWVANTESHNTLRFEPDLRGRFVKNRVTRVDLLAPARVTPIDLNPGVDYDLLPNPGALAQALAQPTDVAFSPDGTELWVAAFGTDRVALLDAAGNVVQRIEVGGTPGTATAPRTKRGPRALAHHPQAPFLYVVAQLSGSVVTLDTRARRAVAEVSLGPDPTPASVRAGRGFLYDSKLSGNGLSSCASCHVDGRRDGLAWDLGDPWGEMRVLVREREPRVTFELHPMKGPLLTQTLLGLAGEEPFHWRGDRADLADFNVTFRTLLGGQELGAADLATFLGYLHSLRFAPNPNQNPDRTYTTTPAGESAADGARFFQDANFSGAANGPTCASCHARPSGSSDEVVANRETAQYMSTPQLRDLYQRRGRRPVGGVSTSGFGILHGGHENGVFEFLSSNLAFLGQLRGEDHNKRMLERFLLEFDTGTAPAVGRSVTVTRRNAGDRSVRDGLALLTAQALAGNCGLVADARTDAGRRSWAWNPAAPWFLADAASTGPRTLTALLADARAGDHVTFLAVPSGTERTHSIDQNRDGVLDGDERPARYGQPSPRCGPALELMGNSVARVGRGDFALVARGGARHGAYAMLLGFGPTATPAGDLTLLVAPEAAVVFVAPGDRFGVGALALDLPSDPGLVGQTLYAQAFSASGCGRIGLAASNGLAVGLRR